MNGAIRDLETIENNGEVTGWEVRECFQKVDPAKPIYEAIHLIQDAFAEPSQASFFTETSEHANGERQRLI